VVVEDEGRAAVVPDHCSVRELVQLLDRGALLPWSWEGYGDPVRPPGLHEVAVLTPPANLVVLKAGFTPLLHPTALGN
jgi:hypothetical protein